MHSFEFLSFIVQSILYDRADAVLIDGFFGFCLFCIPPVKFLKAIPKLNDCLTELIDVVCPSCFLCPTRAC